MNYMGIPNYYITGTATSSGTGGGGGHAWNAVSVDGGETYLYMDLTWGDFEEDGYAYPYFGMPASDFETTHFKNDSAGTGSAWLYLINAVFNDSFEGTFYKQGGFFYDSSFDAAAFASEIIAKARRSGDYVSFMASSMRDLRNVANELGVGVSYYSVTYKGTDYYYMIVRVAEEHTHVLVAHEAVAPTCTEEGNTAYWECSECGRYFSDAAGETEITPNSWIVAALGHQPVVDEAVPATCTEPGKNEGSHCSVCWEVIVAQEEVAALGHTPVVDEAVPATCTESGKTEGSHCSVCGEVIVAQEEILALGHTPVVDEAVAATCTEPGKTEGSHCSVCGEVIVAQEEIPALGHTPVVDEAVPATCTEPGKTEGSHCSVCGEVIVAQEEVPALGHQPIVDEAVPATCTELGKTEGSHCSVCGEVIVAQEEIPALARELGIQAVRFESHEQARTAILNYLENVVS